MSRERSVAKEAGMERNNGGVVAVEAESGSGVTTTRHPRFSTASPTSSATAPPWHARR
jgi:hypothetical protein